MKKQILNLGKTLTKIEQKFIAGGIQREQEDSGCSKEMTPEEHARCCFIEPFNIYC